MCKKRTKTHWQTSRQSPSLPICDRLSEAAPGSPTIVSAFACVRRPRAGPSGLAVVVRPGWLAWQGPGGRGPVGPRPRVHAKAL